MGRRRRRRPPRCSPRTRATPRTPSTGPRRGAVRLNESGAHSHVPNGGRERREPDRYRCGAVVGRLEESCENRDRDEAGDLYAELTDELPEDTGPYRALYVKRAVELGGGLGWGGQPPKSLGSRGLVRPFSSGFVAHPSGHLFGGLNSVPTPVRCEHLAPLETEVNQGVLRQVLGKEFTIDLGLYIDVLKRHRLLVLSGFVVALTLAMFSYVRVSADGLTYRNPEVWSNEATLELSDPSYPELRSKLPPTADPNRFTTLVEQYVALATSDDVLRSLVKQGLISRNPEETALGAISATSVASPINGAITPLLKITGMATSPVQATRLTSARPIR